MTIKHFDIGREYVSNTGVPAITEQPGGKYVLRSDYDACVAHNEMLLARLKRTDSELQAIGAGGVSPLIGSAQQFADSIFDRAELSASAPDVTLINEGDMPADADRLAMFVAAPNIAEPATHIVPDHLIERIRKHCDDKRNTAFARSSMREVLQYLAPTCVAPMSDKPACGVQNTNNTPQQPVDKADPGPTCVYCAVAIDEQPDPAMVEDEWLAEMSAIVDRCLPAPERGLILQHARLRAQPASGEDARDAARLDWLDQVAHCADWMESEPTKRVIRAHDGAEFQGDTWRDAIDAAMQQEIQP